ncbi:MAG: transcription termination factor NusA [Planctomycetes bacterium]|nr:transcription termination factor NusA [Planctomycetota bacterium]
MNTDLIRFVDSISRDKSIDKESIFADLEAAMISAARKAYDDAEDVIVHIDRMSGQITATVCGEPIDMKTLGRIAAQTAKQVMIQKIREDERTSIFNEYSQRVGEIVSGTVTRYEGGALTVNLGRTEAILPRSEQIPGEMHQSGERVRGMILDVRELQSDVRIVLTQTHPDYIRKLFEIEVPEVAERIIEVRALAREAGYRTKIAVSSIDSKVDAVGACVGVRGSRIRNIVDELGGEKIDIVRWNESSQILIGNALKPAEVKETYLCFELGRATVIVNEEQLSLAIGKRGQNVRLAARLTGWDIDILTPEEYDKSIDGLESALRGVDGVEDLLLDKMMAFGVLSAADLEEIGADPLVKELGLEAEVAERIITAASAAVANAAKEAQAAKEAEAAKRLAEKEQAAGAGGSEESATESSAEASGANGDAVEQAAASSAADSDDGTSSADDSDDGASSADDSDDGANSANTAAPGDTVEPGVSMDDGKEKPRSQSESAPAGTDGETNPAEDTPREGSSESIVEAGTVEAGETGEGVG